MDPENLRQNFKDWMTLAGWTALADWMTLARWKALAGSGAGNLEFSYVCKFELLGSSLFGNQWKPYQILWKSIKALPNP